MNQVLIPPRRFRAKTRDSLTFDNAFRTIDTAGNMLGKRLEHAFKTHDGKRTVDSTGAFMVGELERLDMTMHEPLAAVTWSRDIDLREDVTIADEVSSFTLSTFGASGSLGSGNGIGNGKAWIGKSTDQITGVSADIAKIPHQLRPWAMELKYTILELESAAKAGRPIDQQKYEGLQLKHQMDIDEQVYIGDTGTGDTGLVNNSLVTNVQNLPAGVATFTTWVKKTPDEILADVNLMLTSVWQTSAWAIMPDPPAPAAGSVRLHQHAEGLERRQRVHLEVHHGEQPPDDFGQGPADDPARQVVHRRGCRWYHRYPGHRGPCGRVHEGQEAGALPDDDPEPYADPVRLHLPQDHVLLPSGRG
jgi:hypothetical protein